MNILLVAINAKYIHSNLAVYSLRGYAIAHGQQVSLAEYTINQRTDYILEQIYCQKPDLLAFSCYIWNIDYVLEIAHEFHKLCPQIPIWVGGPEVSFETEAFLKQNPMIRGCMMGEGERTFCQLCEVYTKGENVEAALESLEGISFRREDGSLQVNPLRTLMSMDEIPFCYGDMRDFQHRIIYYESSRGCPFNCSYCLSSVDKTLRFRSLDLVYKELQFFIDHQVPQVKFVDRTFNCKHEHAIAIWTYIKEHDNGITNFHFEVSADILNQEELALISDMRPGLIQLEIGVQSTHPATIREIHRTMKLEDVHAAVSQVQNGQNIHQHLDLIAGLPHEDYETFQKSFHEIYTWKPEQLQLGFLKVLKGSYMYEHAEEYGIVYRSKAPYEVMATKWLSYDDILEIKLVEEMLEVHYNSGQFRTALQILEKNYENYFQMFLDMGHYYKKHKLLDCNHSRIKRTDIFLEFALSVDPERENYYKEALLFDLYRIEKSKSRPAWAPQLNQKLTGAYLRGHGLEKKYCHMEAYQYLRLELSSGTEHSFAISEAAQPDGEQWLLFDYEKRDPLTNGAQIHICELPEE